MDGRNSAYLVKSASSPWDHGCLLGVDAGCLMSAITSIVEDDADSTRSNGNNATIFPAQCRPHSRATSNAYHIVTSYISSFCLTHQHLDHIAGIALNSVALRCDAPKTLYGFADCLDALVRHIFNDRIWPNITDHRVNGRGLVEKYDQPSSILKLIKLLPTIEVPGVANNLSLRAFPVSHGTPPVNNMTSAAASEATFGSTAYFIADDVTAKQLLVWGDVESDTVSALPRNLPVWTYAAQLFQNGLLAGVFIECSYMEERPDAMLYGHLKPSHLIGELVGFANLTSMNATLKGLAVYLTHIKLDMVVDKDPYDGIITTVRAFAAAAGLECTFDYAMPGAKILL